MKKVLVFAPYYLPGNKGGGPIVSISNMVEKLSNISFFVLTSDRDLGDKTSYKGIEINKWVKLKNCSIYYQTPLERKYGSLRKIIKQSNVNSIYLNSFFSYQHSIKIVLLKKLRLINEPIILAPRGELSTGALSLKKRKKQLFIAIIELTNCYKGITWHASSSHEKKEIKQLFPSSKVIIAPNITLPPKGIKFARKRKETNLKIAFISRISEKKNLALTLEILKNSNITYNIDYDIFGPVEDKNYWKECQKIISQLPPNIIVKYQGVIEHHAIFKTISNYDGLLFLTKGENFGHVIFESLYAGTPIIVSPYTPWIDLREKKIGWNVDYDNPQEVVNAINELRSIDDTQYNDFRASAHHFAKEFSEDPTNHNANKSLFL